MSQVIAKIEMDNGISFSVKKASLPLSMGRDRSCEICVPVSRVSRHHCELYLEDEVLCIRDISTNGTLVGSKKINRESIPLHGRTPIVLTDNAMLTITPYDENEMLADRRLDSERRAAERRRFDRRTSDVSVVQFERRRDGTRRVAQRRTESRRSAC